MKLFVFLKQNDIKVSQYREQLELYSFLVTISEIIYNWSRRRDPTAANNKVFQQEIPISTNQWKSAYEWAKENRSVIEIECNFCSEEMDECPGNHYFISKERIEEKEAKLFSNFLACPKSDSFEELFSSLDKIRVVVMRREPNEWLKSTCTCPVFFKQFICHHIIGLAIRLKYTSAPICDRGNALIKKAKRGPKPRAAKALLRK